MNPKILSLLRTPPRLLAAGLLLSACAPTTGSSLSSKLNSQPPPPTTYRAQPAEIAQTIREVSSAFERLPGFQSLVFVPGKSSDTEVFLTAPIRVTERGQVVSAVNVLDERELIFLLGGKGGQTSVDYRMKGQLDQQLATVMNALDKRFERVLP